MVSSFGSGDLCYALHPHDETLGFVLGWDVPWDEAAAG